MVLHTANPKFRDIIDKEGLVPNVGDSYRLHWESRYPGVIPLPAIFAVSVDNISEAYDSTYDDDIWEIVGVDMSLFVKDKACYDGCIVTNLPIKRENIKLIYQGTGKSL